MSQKTTFGVCMCKNCCKAGAADLWLDLGELAAGQGAIVEQNTGPIKGCGPGKGPHVQITKRSGLVGNVTEDKVAEARKFDKMLRLITKEIAGADPPTDMSVKVARIKYNARRAEPDKRSEMVAEAFNIYGGEQSCKNGQSQTASELLVIRSKGLVSTDAGKALKDAQEASKLAPGKFEPKIAVSYALDAAGRFGEAASALEDAIKLASKAETSDLNKLLEKIKRKAEMKSKEAVHKAAATPEDVAAQHQELDMKSKDTEVDKKAENVEKNEPASKTGSPKTRAKKKMAAKKKPVAPAKAKVDEEVQLHDEAEAKLQAQPEAEDAAVEQVETKTAEDGKTAEDEPAAVKAEDEPAAVKAEDGHAAVKKAKDKEKEKDKKKRTAKSESSSASYGESSASTGKAARSGRGGFEIGDHVVIIKEARTKGKTAVVIDPNRKGMIRVKMDEPDPKGDIKHYRLHELELIEPKHDRLQLVEEEGQGSAAPPLKQVEVAVENQQESEERSGKKNGVDEATTEFVRHLSSGRGSLWASNGKGKDFDEELESRFQAQAKEDAKAIQQAMFLAGLPGDATNESISTNRQNARKPTVQSISTSRQTSNAATVEAQAGISLFSWFSCCVVEDSPGEAGEAPATPQY